MTGRMVVGRSGELQAVTAFAQDAATGPALLLLTGEAGIGKTTLWVNAVQTARTGRIVLSSRPVEQDAETPYGGLADLLHPHLEAISQVVPNHDAGVIEKAVLDGAAEPRSLRHALRAALVGLAQSAPVLIAIDDLQWLDGATRRLLGYAFGQLTHEPVGLVAAVRTASTGDGPAAELLRVAGSAHTTSLNLDPLPAPTLAELISDRLGLALPDYVNRRIHGISGGNPLFALELAKEWKARGQPADVPVPESLVALLEQSLRQLPDATQELLAAVATLGRPTVPQLTALLGREVGAEIDGSVVRGVLNVESVGTVRFAHPLQASALQHLLPWEHRSRLHLQAADLVSDPVERGRHLALATADPDADVAAALDAAAADAATRGAPDAAAELAEHARRLTPKQDRPARHARSLAVGAYFDACGRFRAAIEAFDEVVSAPDAGPNRAPALLARAALEDNMARRSSLVHSALATTCSESLKARAYNLLAWSEGFLQLSLDAGVEHARRALEMAERADDLEQRVIALGRLAHLLAIRGQPHTRLLERAMPGSRAVTVDDRPEVMLGLQLMWRGELERAKDLLEAQYAEAVRLNDDSARPFLLVQLTDLAARRGAGDEVVRYAAERRRLVASQAEFGGVLSNYVEAVAASYAGPPQTARDWAEAGVAEARARGLVTAELRLRHVLGVAHLLSGDHRSAWAALEPTLTVVGEQHVGEPGFIPVISESVAALAVLGETRRAQQVTAMLEDSAASGHPWATATRTRCNGLALLATGEAEASATELLAARDAFDNLGCKFDAARSTYEAGAALRRAGRRGAAHESISEAVQRFTAMGAFVWAESTAKELGRAAGRRAGNLLTAGEERVAKLVAAGHSNREIAAELYVSVATVEANLTRVYRKLGVTSRSQLTRRLTAASNTD